MGDWPCKDCASFARCDVDEDGAEEAGMPDDVRGRLEDEWAGVPTTRFSSGARGPSARGTRRRTDKLL